MDTAIISWRWPNVLAIWIAVILLGFILAFGAQGFHLVTGHGDNA